MDITGFFTSKREQAFLLGDHGSYHRQLSRQLLATKRRLGRTTAKGTRFAKSQAVSVENIAGHQDFVHLLILQSERAWAQGRHLSSVHAEDRLGIKGRTRRHVLSRLHKATRISKELANLLFDTRSNASVQDYLEAKAYSLCHAGAEEFERQSPQRHGDAKAAWEKCLIFYSEAHVIYTALVAATRKEVFREQLLGAVEPSIRYAAYQSKIDRTYPISVIAKQHFRPEQSDLILKVQSLHPTSFDDERSQAAISTDGTITIEIPKSINWRGRDAHIADAAIGQSIAATNMAATTLASRLVESSSDDYKALATIYDSVLTAAQDTIDATRRALLELSKEGISDSDDRIQDLRVIDLYAHYKLIGWRIGRNRVLMSTPSTSEDRTSSPIFDDGMNLLIYQSSNTPYRRPRASSKAGPLQNKPNADTNRFNSKTRTLARLRERVVLYASTLQSIDSLKQLPGAGRDTSFIAELNALGSYFSSLKALNTARSYAVSGLHREALALFVRAATFTPAPQGAETKSDLKSPVPTLTVSSAQENALYRRVSAEVLVQHGIVAMEQLDQRAVPKTYAKMSPLVVNLNSYPVSGADLTNLVLYPPKLEPVPIKPVFFDLAWNCIHYPIDRIDSRSLKHSAGQEVLNSAEEQAGEKKNRSWFGFGR